VFEAADIREWRGHNHDHSDQPVHPLAAARVGEAAKHTRAEEGGEQHRGVEQGELARTQVPVLGDQGGGDPDDEQVVSLPFNLRVGAAP
jgi:hypothetical protein